MKKTIPAEDLKDINRILNPEGTVQAINKAPDGSTISAKAEKPKKTFTIQDFHGRIVRHQKSVFAGGKQTTVAEAGQLFDDIPSDLRKTVDWFESDFQ